MLELFCLLSNDQTANSLLLVNEERGIQESCTRVTPLAWPVARGLSQVAPILCASFSTQLDNAFSRHSFFNELIAVGPVATNFIWNNYKNKREKYRGFHLRYIGH